MQPDPFLYSITLAHYRARITARFVDYLSQMTVTLTR